MPIKDKLKVPQSKIQKAVTRMLAGESAEAVARELGTSRATAYNYLRRHRDEVLEKARAQELGPDRLERERQYTMRAELEALRAENRKLKERVFELMTQKDPLLRGLQVTADDPPSSAGRSRRKSTR